MRKFVVTWTFMRHIHRHREYKILTEVIWAKNEYMAAFYMNDMPSVKAIRKKEFKDKLKSVTAMPALFRFAIQCENKDRSLYDVTTVGYYLNAKDAIADMKPQPLKVVATFKIII